MSTRVFCVTVLVRRLKGWMIYTASRLCLNTTSASICILLSVRLLKRSSFTVSVPWLKGCYPSFFTTTTTWRHLCFSVSVRRLQLGLVAAVRVAELPAGEAACHDDQGTACLPYWRMVRMQSEVGKMRPLTLWIHTSGGGRGGSDIRSMTSILPSCKCRCPRLSAILFGF